MRHIRTRRNSKEKNQRYHAKIRMLQHYGIQITNSDLEKMSEIYRHNPDVVILRRQSNRVVKAIIPYNGAVYPIVYDRHRKQIVTILKEEYLSPRQRKIFENCKERLSSSQTNVSQVVNPVIPSCELPIDTNSIEEHRDDSSGEVNEHEEKTYVDVQSIENSKLMEEAFERLPNF